MSKNKTQLKLNSVVPDGVGSGSESLALDLIYEFLLHEYSQDLYDYISINQVGDDLDEFIEMESDNKIHINLRYPTDKSFEAKSEEARNKDRLDVIHTALLKISQFDKRLDSTQLEAIRRKILANDFSFEFLCKSYQYKNDSSLVGELIVSPKIDKFEYYIKIKIGDQIKCKVLVYNGRPGLNIVEFFNNGKWKNENELIVWGTKKEVEIHILVTDCKVSIVNLTSYTNPPYFTVMRSDVSEEERGKAFNDWLHSLPPAVAAIIRDNHN